MDTFVYSGINSVSSAPKFLFPDLIHHEQSSSYYMYVESRIGEKLPPHLNFYYKKRFEVWPEMYRNPIYQFPLSFNFTHYLKDNGYGFPKSEYELRTNHKKIAATFLDLYPGGLLCNSKFSICATISF